MASATARPVSTDGLWEKSYNSLDDGLRASINSAKTGRNDILAAVLETARRKREICIHKQWKVKLPKGEVIIIRDVVEKIARWVNIFIAVGDVAVQYDPVSAALPWAAVRFVLQAAISDTQIEGAMVADMETISRLIARYKEFETIYLAQESSVKRQIEETLIRLYADVLKFLAMAVRYFDTNSLVRGVKSTLKTPDRNLMETILQREAELLKIAGLSNSEKLHYLTSSVKRLVDQVASTQKILDETRHLELLRWLSSSPFTRHHEMLSETRMANSATWLLDHSEYKSWRNSSSSSILLLHGIPGSGKSRICSAVVDSLLDDRTNNPLAAPVAYFYCADCEFEPERARPDNVMRSILRQLTINADQPTVNNIILSEFERRLAQSKVDGMDMPRLAVKDCIKLLLEVTITDPVTIVVDALDEIGEHDRPILIQSLEEIVVGSPSVVKVFLTSRNNSHVFSLLRNGKTGLQPTSTQRNVKTYLKNVEINRDNTLQDMQNYVNLALVQAVNDRRLLKEDPSPELWDLLVQKLVPGAGEMFQWVNIQIEYLCQYKTENHMKNALQTGNLATLDDTYGHILERVLSRRDGSRDIAIRAFSWLLYMREAMSPDDFLSAAFSQIAVADPTKSREELTTICSSLVLLDSKCNTFRFSHHSIQEFLLKRDLFSPESAHEVLASNCLKICMNGPSDPASLDTLYRYSALYWAYHCSQTAISNDDNAIPREIISFIYDDPGDVSLSFIGWLDHIASISRKLADDHPMKTIGEAISNPEGSPLFVASAFGLDCLLKDINLNVDPFDWDQKNDRGHTSLYLACAFGKDSAAEILLNHGADPNARCGKFGNPLQAACFAGHNSTVRLLLKNGALMHAEGAFSSAFEACIYGHKEEPVETLLKCDGAIRNAEDFYSVLGGAAQAGFLKIIKALERLPLASQYEASGPNKRKQTAGAIKGGQAGTLANFLKNKPNPADFLPDGPIAMAAIYGHEDIIELLVGMNIDLEGECMLGSPLRCAALMEHERVIHKLIKLGADVNRCGRHGTALQAAAMKGHIRIVKLLLRSGAKIDQQGGIYGTALHAAAYQGHRDVAEVLLDAGANMHITGISIDAFHSAVEGGHYEILKLMLDRGFEFYHSYPGPMASMAPEIYNPLLRNYSPSRKGSGRANNFPKRRMASHMEHSKFGSGELSYQDVFAWFGNLRSDGYSSIPKHAKRLQLGHRDRHSENYALGFGAAAGHLQTVAILLESKSVLGISDGEVLDSLKLAARHGHLEVFHLISSALPSPLPINEFLTALGEAAKNGHMKILSSGIEQAPIGTWSDQHLRTLVGIACRTTRATVEKLLPAATKNTSTECFQDIIGFGLIKAATDGHAHIVDFLLENGIDCKKEATCEAFVAACCGGHAAVISRMLHTDDKKTVDRLVHKGLKASASRGRADVVAYLVDHLSSTGQKMKLNKPLFSAARKGQLDAVKVLLRCRETWEDYTTNVTRALTAASFNGHEECVQALISAGADVNAVVPEVPDDDVMYRLWLRSNANTNALQAALDGIKSREERHIGEVWVEERNDLSHERIVKILLDHGSDSNNLGGHEVHPIIVAAEYCSEQVVSWLIEAGADVNAISEGKNAVLAASGRELSSAGVLQRLLQAGARLQTDACPVGSLFFSCLEYFLEDGHFKRTRTLEDAMNNGPGAVAQIILKALPLVMAYQENFRGLLQAAIVLDDRPCYDLLLQRGVDINSAGCYYGTALQAAARFGRVELVQRLLEAGANPNIISGHHHTALRAAVVGSHATVVRSLLRHGADINLAFNPKSDPWDTRGSAPLLNLAVESGNSEIMIMLVSAGIDVIDPPPEHVHPLILACESGNLESARCLLESGAPVGVASKRGRYYWNDWNYWNDWTSPLHMASHHGHEKIICLLLEWKADVNMEVEDSMTPLQLALGNGHIGPIRLLLQAGADIDRVSSNQQTALSIAASNGHVGPIRLLLQAGADVDHVAYRGETALSIAADRGHLDAVRELLAANATIYDPGKTKNALAEACHSGSLVVVELLLEATSNMKHREQAILEALKAAAEKKNSEMLSLLSEYTNHGIKVFHEACTAGSLPLVSRLLDKGVPVDGEDENGVRALPLAAYHLQVDVVKILVGRGAGIDHGHPIFGSALSAAIYGCIKDGLPQEAMPEQHRTQQDPHFIVGYLYEHRGPSRGWKPNAARTSRCEEIVRLLVDHGASVMAEPREFGLPLHLASFFGNTKIISALLSVSANVHSEAGYFKTPLFAAIYQGHLEIVELLLRESSDIAYNHPEFGTPLFLALQKGKMRIIQALLDSGGDPNSRGPDGRRFLSTAISMASSSNIWTDPERQTTFFQGFLSKAKGVKISSTDMIQAAQISRFGTSPILDFMDYDTNITVPEEAIIASLNANRTQSYYQEKNLNAFLKHNPHMTITESIFLAIFDQPSLEASKAEILIKLLQKYHKKLIFTDKMRNTIERIDKNYPDAAIKKLFLTLKKNLVTDLKKPGSRAPAQQGLATQEGQQTRSGSTKLHSHIDKTSNDQGTGSKTLGLDPVDPRNQ